jgi:hypothetical protein
VGCFSRFNRPYPLALGGRYELLGVFFSKILSGIAFFNPLPYPHGDKGNLGFLEEPPDMIRLKPEAVSKFDGPARPCF